MANVSTGTKARGTRRARQTVEEPHVLTIIFDGRKWDELAKIAKGRGIRGGAAALVRQTVDDLYNVDSRVKLPPGPS